MSSYHHENFVSNIFDNDENKIAAVFAAATEVFHVLRWSKDQERIIIKTINCFFVVFCKSAFNPAKESCNHGKWF